MKKLFFFLVLAATCSLYSCKSNTTTTDTSNTSGNKSVTDSTRKSATMLVQEDQDFITKAASGSMMEVELGKVAQQKSGNKRIKDFAMMMVTDHSQANEELKGLAASKKITVPSSMIPEHQKHVDAMNVLSGTEFDKKYMTMMLDDHKEDVSDFKKTSKEAKDADLRSFATKTLPVLLKHLDSAKAINGKM